MATSADDVLGADPRPRTFRAGALPPGLERPPAPADPGRVAVRAWARSLAGMQKEVLVATSADDALWRLVSDEGGDLNGHDRAPFPLGHLAVGLAASVAEEVLALAAQRGVEVSGLRVVLDNHYTMEGSALRGTMVGGALAPDVRVEGRTGLDAAAWTGLVCDAVGVSAASGLLRAASPGDFTLTVDGRRVEGAEVPPAAGDLLDGLRPDDPSRPGRALLERAEPDEPDDPAGDGGGGLQEAQSRVLKVRGSCTVGEDGVLEVVQQLRSPAGGSAWRALCDRPVSAGGQGRAPDAATYVAAGLAFCFLTQLGRYATIVRKQLPAYEVVQDLELPLAGASGATGRAGTAGAPTTHVFLSTPEGDEFARTALRMGEQTCFLHALCRSPLVPRVRARLLA